MAWIYLLLASAAEVSFTTALRLSDNFRNLLAVAVFVASVVVSLALLEMAQRQIPLGTAYVVWSGIGAVGTLGVGILFFGEPASLTRALLVIGIVACVAGLKASGGNG
jgi:quaternary ammonium compound-resistance protein SugE